MNDLVVRLLSQRWTPLTAGHHSVELGEYPGVYLLAFSEENLQGKAINLSEVLYVGMSNSLRGVNQRLGQFASAIEGKPAKHVAGRRFFKDKKWGNGIPFSKMRSKKHFYVAAITMPCEVKKSKRGPEDLRKMGDVACLEYYALARVKEEKQGWEPELNVK